MIGALLRTIICRLFFIIFLVLCLPFFILVIILPRSWIFENRFFFFFESIFHTVVLKLSLLPITFHGLSNLTDQPAIFVANHQSSFDVPLLGYVMRGHPHIWLSMAALRRSPLLRFLLPKISILVDMSTPSTGVRSLLQAIATLHQTKSHLIIFPEGGRFTDGKIHHFYGGFSLIARKTHRPVIPVYIHGLNKVYPPGSFIVYSYPVTVTIGPALTMHEGETDDMFKDRVHQWFLQQAESAKD